MELIDDKVAKPCLTDGCYLWCGQTAIVCVMLANNEVGALQPIETLVRAVKDKQPQTLIMTDASQAVGVVRCPRIIIACC